MSDAGCLAGHLELVCDVDARGLTRLRHQSFRAPVHLSKPYHDGGALVLNVVNPTAGLLDGDRLRSDVKVEHRARLVLTTPSASRIHTMRGGHAEVTQRFHIDAAGSLEVWGEPLIPQRGARYRQQTDLVLEAGAEVLFFETLAPGRVASGEVFVYDELRWATDVRLQGRLIVRERYCLAPGSGSLAALRERFPHAYYASAVVISPHWLADPTRWNALRALHTDAAWLGLSRLTDGAIIIKLLATDSIIFRRTLYAIRGAVYTALGRPPPGLRRVGSPPA